MKLSGAGGPQFKGAVTPDLDLVLVPLFDDGAGFRQRLEDLAFEQLAAHAGVKALDVAVFPW